MFRAESESVVNRAPDCRTCVFFSLVGDPAMPYACRQFEIKSARLPSYDVFLATGHHCPVYRKNPRQEAPRELDKGGWLA